MRPVAPGSPARPYRRPEAHRLGTGELAPQRHPEERRLGTGDEGSLRRRAGDILRAAGTNGPGARGVPRALALGGLVLGLLGVPTTAHAHLVTTGLGPLYDGISHLFLSFEDLLPVIALSLLAGLNGPKAGRLALFIVPAAWLLGGLAGFTAGMAPLPSTVTAASFLVLGGLTAADRRLPPTAVTALAAALGLFHGWLNGAGIAAARREVLGLAGIVSAVFVVVALLAALVIWLRPAWTRIAVRVAGSWIAAIGLLLLGWGLRGTS